MTLFLRVASYRNVDNDVKFLLNDKAIHNITINGDYTSLTNYYSDNISFIILPTKKVDINSYLLLAKQLEGHDVYILSYLMNEFYIEEPLRRLVKEKDYYIISHGDIDEKALKQIKNIPNVKGLILLDGEIVDYSNDLYLCTDVKHKKCKYIEKGSFDGFANYENKKLNKLTAAEQQKLTIDLILSFVGDRDEK